MKHSLNNLTEEEKNSIREQHKGVIEVNTSRFKTIMESSLGNVKPLLNEQVSSGTTQPTTVDSVINDFTQKGYKDITDWYFSPEGVVYIPDGDYVGSGWGYYENVLTKDGKDTGYVFVFKGMVRDKRKDTVRVANNGGGVGTTGGKIYKILLNDKILDSSGIRKK